MQHRPALDCQTYQTVSVVTILPVPQRIAVERDELDPDTLEHDGLEAAVHEAALSIYLEALRSGAVEVEIGTAPDQEAPVD